jgi:DNA-binding NtrC family response regulator
MKSWQEALKGFNQEYLVELMQASQGKVYLAAKLSGIHRGDLYKRLKRYGVDVESFRKGGNCGSDEVNRRGLASPSALSGSL